MYVIAERLQKLINLGFQLTDIIIKDSIKSFESRTKTIKESMLEAFNKVRGETTPDVVAATLIKIKRPEKKTRKRRRRES